MFKNFIKAFNEYTTYKNHVPAPYIRRGFELDFIPENAKIAVATAGLLSLPFT